MRLFWRQGDDGASLSDLTRELGVSRPSLYAAFGSKQALFLKALDLYEAQAGYRQGGASPPAPPRGRAVGRQSLYAAFGSKQALFLKALDLYEAQAGYRQAALAAP